MVASNTGTLEILYVYSKLIAASHNMIGRHHKWHWSGDYAIRGIRCTRIKEQEKEREKQKEMIKKRKGKDEKERDKERE